MPNEFEKPQSRNEAILQNMLGAENELSAPESRIESLLQKILEQGGTDGKKFELIESIEVTDAATSVIRRSGYDYTKMLIRGRLASGECGITQTFINELGCGWWNESSGDGVIDTYAQIVNGMFFSVYGSQMTTQSGGNTPLVRREISFGQLIDGNIENIRIMNSKTFPIGTVFEIYAV